MTPAARLPFLQPWLQAKRWIIRISTQKELQRSQMLILNMRRKWAFSIKLFGTSRIRDGKVSAYVAPVMINSSHPLYGVRDVFNGIMVRGNMLWRVYVLRQRSGKAPYSQRSDCRYH